LAKPVFFHSSQRAELVNEPSFSAKSRARQAVDGRLNLLHLVRGDPGRLPKLAGLIRINFPHHQEVRFFSAVDVFL